MERNKRYDTDDLSGKFYEGNSTTREDTELRALLSKGAESGNGDRATAAMFELFRQEREVSYPGSVVPLRRARRFGLMFRSAAAAVAAILTVLSATVWEHEPQTVYCVIDGKPVTDYHIAIEHGEKAMEIISESIEKTVAMHDPLNEVGRVLKELKQLGIFDTAVQQEDNKAKKL